MAKNTYNYADIADVNAYIRQEVSEMEAKAREFTGAVRDLVESTWGGDAASEYGQRAEMINKDLVNARESLDSLGGKLANSATNMGAADEKGKKAFGNV